MRKLKIVLFLLTFIFIICIFAQANELKIHNQSKFSFISHSKSASDIIGLNLIRNKITNYRSSSSQKAKGFKGMGIAGAVIFGVSWIFTISGTVLMVIYYMSMYSSLWTFNLTATMGGIFGNLWMLYLGAGIFALGMLMFWAGLPLMIVGFAVSAYHSKRVSMLIETDMDRAQISSGIAIKL